MTAQPADPSPSRGPAKRAGNASGRKELKKSAVTRQRILEAAAAIFARKGYGRALMGEIAQDARVHITALYYHFSTKDDLAEEVMNHVARANHADLTASLAALPADTPFAAKLRVAIDAQLEAVIARRNFVIAQLKLLSELPEVRQKRHRELLREASNFWRDLLQEGLNVGAVRRDLDLSVARMVIQGAIAWTVEWYRPGGRKAGEISDQITETMLSGMVDRDRG